MTDQNQIKHDGKKMPKQIRIKRDGKEMTIKIEIEYDSSNVDNELLNYFKKLPIIEANNILDSLENDESKIFKIMLEYDDNNYFIRDMYDAKRQTWIASNPIKYEKCSEIRDIKKCVDNQLPQLYDFLVVKKKDILPDVAPDVSQPIVAQTQPIVAQGGTRRRRNNKKNKRKSRNNRKKINRRC